MPPSQHQAAPMQHPAHQPQKPKRRKHIDWAARTIRIELFIVIVGSALLLAAVALYMGLSGNINPEAKRVNKDKYQAVFINSSPIGTSGYSGQLYFGKITSLNNNYLVLRKVYFLTNQTDQNNQTNPQLTKLGCQQLHSPYDEMIINRTQVAFWENLEDRGKVVTAIKEFEKQNPNGPNCDQQTTTPPAATPAPLPTPPAGNR